VGTPKAVGSAAIPKSARAAQAKAFARFWAYGGFIGATLCRILWMSTAVLFRGSLREP